MSRLLFLTGLLLAALSFPSVGLAQSYGDGNYSDNEYGGTSNAVPLISLSAPTAGQSFTSGVSVTVTASSSDQDGSIAQVEFLVDSVSIGTSSSPYTRSWTATGPGTHTIEAVAADNEGAHATATVAITVAAASSGGSSSGSSGTSSSKKATATSTTETASLETLQQKVDELTRLLAQLLALRDGTQSVAPTGFIFENNLTVGSEHPDVQKLQQFLNAKKFTVSTVGAGSPGHESTYFGQLTREALAVFQSTHDIVPAVGFFGPVTRDLVNSILKQ